MLDVTFIHLIAAGLDILLRPNPLELSQKVAENASATETSHVTERELIPVLLIPGLLATVPVPTGQVINQCVEDIWQSCQEIGIPADLAEAHLAVLPLLLSNAELTIAERRSLLAPQSDTIAADAAQLAERLTSSAVDVISTNDLDETVLGFLLERFFLSLASSHKAIEEIQDAISNLPLAAAPATLAPRATLDADAIDAPAAIRATPPAPAPPPPHAIAQKPSAAGLTLAKIERADALCIPVPILDTITVTLINLTKSATIRQADLLAAAATARALAARLADLGRHSVAHMNKAEAALVQFNAGRLADCDRILASIEDPIVTSSIGPIPNEVKPTKIALEIRIIRAEIQALAGAFLKAARHYGFAQRYIARQDYEDRWPIALKEARHYELAAFYTHQDDSLDKAARTCTSALAAIPPVGLTISRADVQTELARLLIILGQKEDRPERFELAAQLLADAELIYRDASIAVGSLNAATHKAEALTLLGDHLHDSDILAAAAHHYQAALKTAASLLSTDASPTDPAIGPDHILDLRTGMALAIASLARNKGTTSTEDEALAIVADALPLLISRHQSCPTAGFAHHARIARSHTALSIWHASRDETVAAASHVEQAIEAYGAATMPATAKMLRNRFNSNYVTTSQSHYTATKATAA